MVAPVHANLGHLHLLSSLPPSMIMLCFLSLTCAPSIFNPDFDENDAFSYQTFGQTTATALTLCLLLRRAYGSYKNVIPSNEMTRDEFLGAESIQLLEETNNSVSTRCKIYRRLRRRIVFHYLPSTTIPGCGASRFTWRCSLRML